MVLTAHLVHDDALNASTRQYECLRSIGFRLDDAWAVGVLLIDARSRIASLLRHEN